MSPADLLNAELPPAGQALRAGLDWWLGELSDMVPPAWKRALSGRPAVTAELRADGRIRLVRDGREIHRAPLTRIRPLEVRLLLPPDEALTREAALPRLPDRDLRRLVALDIDRLTPFQAEAVFADVAVLGPDARPQLQRVLVAAVARERAARALAQARAAGLEPAALSVAGAPAEIDFLPALRKAEGRARADGGRWVWGVIALLAVTNLLVAVVRDAADTAQLRAAVELQKPRVREAAALRSQVQDEAARRAAVARQHGEGEPLRVLDALTRAIPDGAWVQRMTWDGRAVRLAGYRQDTVDVVAALRASPMFEAPRSSVADTPARGAAGQPFDITAEVAPEAPQPGRPAPARRPPTLQAGGAR